MGERTGEKVGWTGGWLGGFIWVLVLAVVFLVQQKWEAGLIGLLVVVSAAALIFFFPPWRYPATAFWKLMSPLYVMLAVAVVWVVWAFDGFNNEALRWWNFLGGLPLLTPLIVMGRRRWIDGSVQVDASREEGRPSQ